MENHEASSFQKGACGGIPAAAEAGRGPGIGEGSPATIQAGSQSPSGPSIRSAAEAGSSPGLLSEMPIGQRPRTATETQSGVGTGEEAIPGQIPEGVRATAAPSVAGFDARRLRSQRDIIRDVMVAAADCDTWLTLGELHALTHYGEASISAQLRHLRKSENGGYDVIKRHREGAIMKRPGADGRGECVWEYCIARETRELMSVTASREPTVQS